MQYLIARAAIVVLLMMVGSCANIKDNKPIETAAGTGPVKGPEFFTLAVLPDTQEYARLGYPWIFVSQTRWIQQHHTRENIVFVLHEGDITSENTKPEWDLANSAFSLLDGEVPYLLTPGNHDVPFHAAPPGDPRDTANFNKTFPVTRYQNESWWGGHMKDDPDQRFGLFSAGGLDFMVLTLEFMPNDRMLDWANELVSAHPERRVIVLTHSYTLSDGMRVEPVQDFQGGPLWKVHANSGEEIWEKFVKRHKNIFLVLSGHVITTGGRGRLTSRGDHGNEVHQVLSNYQNFENGGNGWLRLMRFEPAADRIVVRTYSTWLDQYSDHAEDNFILAYSMGKR
jgi:hypothetical protein